jgi:hypothetical protein
MSFPGALAFRSSMSKGDVIGAAIIGMIMLITFTFTDTPGPLPSFLDDLFRKCHGIVPPRMISEIILYDIRKLA